MLKLVAADMDGTLLDSSHNMPEDTAEIIRKMNSAGVKFAAASGRQYQSVRKLFENIGIADEMFFIAENGGIICEKDKLIQCEIIPEDDLHMLLDMLAEMPDVKLILSGVDSAYITSEVDGTDFGENAALYCEKLNVSEDLHKAARSDRITKIAVYEPDAEHGCYPVLKKLGDKFNVVLSGKQWVDIVSKAADKGSALKFLAGHMGITSAQVMAFGDYLNDLSMIEYAGESYAMENAHAVLKQTAKHIAPSNDDHGVTETIKRVILHE